MSEPPSAPGTLYLVATPIGNLQDVTLRALDVLARVQLVACEDTRVTAKLLARHGLAARTVPLHAHNERRQVPRLLARLARGESVALLTDAGTPSIADPGMLLAREARAAGAPVVAIPGPSAVLAALVASGLPAQPFTFVGFLPSRRGERGREVAALSRVPHTLVLFESPRRLAATLADLAASLGPRPAAVCREMTKLHEEVVVAPLPDLARQFAARPTVRGEVTVVVGPLEDRPESVTAAADLLPAFRDALRRAGGDRREAMRLLARELGLPRRVVYRALLAQRDTEPG